MNIPTRFVFGFIALATTVGCGGGSIAISTPAEGATVTVGANEQGYILPISVMSNHTLAAPGACNSGECGHVFVTIDGAACNQSGSAYNTVLTATMGNALLSNCPMVDGSHTLQVELRKDDGSAFSPAITDSVTVTVQRQGVGEFPGTYNLAGTIAYVITSPPAEPMTAPVGSAGTITAGTRGDVKLTFGPFVLDFARDGNTLYLIPGQPLSNGSASSPGTWRSGTMTLNGTTLQGTVIADVTANDSGEPIQGTATLTISGPRQ